ncbi:hypothetical protein [Rhodoferax sp. GW822-FHT02A01]|uniref:hypothetical protein n=1 Tax=Rhodoferax sp. GW822-FHT02A01 TaxID=3141537 RepID=UPI00315C5264
MKCNRNSNQALQVVLGSQTIKAFVASPKEFKVIGIVRMGMEFGLLATSASGAYVRVNGSTVQRLNSAAVEEAIRIARISGRGESYAASRAHTSPVALQAPAVIVRKRRRYIEVPTATVAPSANASVRVAAA